MSPARPARESPRPAGDAPRVRLDFRSGGWVLLLAGMLCLTLVLWAVAGIMLGAPGRIGDGRRVESYGFDLSTVLVPRDQIVAGGISKDYEIRAIVDPATLTLDAIERLREEERFKYLVPDDRVIGVALGGEARAYPLSVLNQHEIVNDTLGGVPIAVTYNPLSDAAVVVNRRVGAETLTFGVSGLLLDSNLLAYDRRDEPGVESLWSPLQRRAIAGPAAAEGATLRVVPAVLTTWSDWLRLHPATDVLAPLPSMGERYEQTYGTYLDSDEIRFPVSPLPPGDGPAPKSRVLVVFHGERPIVFHLPELAAAARSSGGGDAGSVVRTVDERPLEIAYDLRAGTARARWMDTGETPPQAFAFWFAWHAVQRPDE